jgi:hypothetical protein
MTSPADGQRARAGASAPSRLAPAGARAATGGEPDAYDKIAKLALLRDTGALTEEEFEIQKAKLLAEI